MNTDQVVRRNTRRRRITLVTLGVAVATVALTLTFWPALVMGWQTVSFDATPTGTQVEQIRTNGDGPVLTKAGFQPLGTTSHGVLWSNCQHPESARKCTDEIRTGSGKVYFTTVSHNWRGSVNDVKITSIAFLPADTPAGSSTWMLCKGTSLSATMPKDGVGCEAVTI